MRQLFRSAFLGFLVFLGVFLVGTVAHCQDMIDISRAHIVNAPDVRTWPATARITGVSFADGVTRVAFTKQDGDSRWPDVVPPGWKEPLQYTLWLFVRNGDEWAGSGFIQFWHGRDGSGSPADPDVPSVYDKHWYYAARWTPVYGHGPIKPGENIGFMVTSGNARDNIGPNSVQERSNIVVFAATDTGTYSFDAGPPVPPPSPTPQPPAPAPAPSSDVVARLQAIQDQLAVIKQDIDAGRKENRDFYANVKTTWDQVKGPLIKIVLPALAAFLAGHQVAK